MPTKHTEDLEIRFFSKRPSKFHFGLSRIIWTGYLPMAFIPISKKAGVFSALYFPRESCIWEARGLVPILRKALELMREKPSKFEKFSNFKKFEAWLENYLTACQTFPDTLVIPL